MGKIKWVIAVFAAVCGSLAALAARTVSISEQTATAVTFRFGLDDNQSYELFLAHGATDAADDKYGWTDFVKIADVARHQESLVYEVPAQYRDGGFVRFFLMQTKNCAMVQELDRVTSTSQQWVDIGIAPTTRMVADFRFGNVTYEASTTFFGQTWSGSQYLFNQQSNNFHFHGSGTVNTGVRVEGGKDYRMMVDDGSGVYIFSGDGKTQLARVSNGRSVGSGNIAVFCCNNGNNKSSFSFYRFKIARVGSDNGYPIRDLVPAIDINGEVGLYDNVTDAFFRNKTETPLVAGKVRPAARFGRVTDETPSFRFNRSLAVTAFTADAVSLAFDNPDGKAYKLYVASGDADKEDDKNSWHAFTEVADIAADATTYAYTIPAEFKRADVFFRFFLVQTENLPYSTELTSIKSSNAQTVRIGYAPTPDTTADFRFGEVTYKASTTFFGQEWNGHCYLLNQQGSTQFYFHSGGQALEGVLANTDYRCRITSDNYVEISKAGSCNRTAITRFTNPFQSMAVFSCFSGGSGSTFRFYNLKLKDDGLLVRDLIPVRNTAGGGALYDRVNNVVYNNESATAFAQGVVVDRPGRVLSTSLTLVGGQSMLPAYVKLTEDLDLTGQTSRIPDAMEFNLNGHTLKLTGNGDLASKRLAFSGVPGTLDITVPTGSEYTLKGMDMPAKPTIIKRGGGTLVAAQQMSGIPSVVVEEGMLISQASVVFNDATTVTVKNGAGYDMNGYADSNMKLVIEGTGPDGRGALRNSRGAIGNGSAQICALALTGDALITGDFDFGLIRSGYNQNLFELNGHTVTFDLASVNVNFWLVNVTTTTSGTVYVKKGTLDFRHSSYATSMPNVDFIIEGPNAKFNVDNTAPSKLTVRDITLVDGGLFWEGSNRTYIRNMNVFGPGEVTGNVSWIYTSGTVTVSNETGVVNLVSPFVNNGTYPKLVKYGAGTLNIRDNHTDQRFDSGVEIFGGTVVMDSTASTKNYHVAISSQPAPFIIHAGAHLDMTRCAAPVKMSSIVTEADDALIHVASNAIEFPKATTFTRPMPFTFSGAITFTGGSGTVSTFDLTNWFREQGSRFAQGDSVTLLSASSISGGTNPGGLTVKGCPYPYELMFYPGRVELRTKSVAEAALAPIKIFALGSDFVEGVANLCNFRLPLARNLTALGWNVKMTGWHRSYWYSTIGIHTADSVHWNHHGGVKDLALMTSATRAGVLEGLEAYCMTAEDPEFTIFVCGDMDLKDGVSNDKVLAAYKEAVTRIKAALPMTTVIASSIPGGSTSLNADIATWCAAEADVEYVDLASIYGVNGTISPTTCEAAATALTTKITSLATPAGKNTPSTYVKPELKLGAANNVPAAYLQGFTHVRTLEPGEKFQIRHYDDAVPYSYAPPMQKTGIAKVGYFVELVHKVSGDHMAVWVDMDAPGSNWADVALPIFASQTKQMTVHKLHVWSNTRAVSQVAANDDSVDGYIEFNSGNYGGTERTGDVVADPWKDGFGFNDTMTIADTGHGCFQVMRKFSDPNAFLKAEILFAMNRFGANDTANTYALGIGTFANYGNHTYTTSKEIDRTFCYGDPDTDGGRLSSPSYSVRRIEFWLKYDGSSVDRAAMANFQWTNATGDNVFWTKENWTNGDTACGNLDYTVFRFPAGGTYQPTYPHYDNVTHWATKFLLDGTLYLTQIGGFYNDALDVGPTGKLVIDPTRFAWRLRSPPIFEPGSKLALSSDFATNTNGRFLMFYWDQGEIDLDAVTAAFETSSAAGRNPKFTAEYYDNGKGRLWLDLDYGTVKPRINVLSMGDSITQGSNSSYGNWRVPLMKKICASGYEAWTKGYWIIESNDINNHPMPDAWIHHAGISGQRLRTLNGGGTLDAIEATLDQAGNVDFVLAKLGTNDINSDGATAETLFPLWVEFVNRVLTLKPHAIFIAGALVDIAYDANKNAQVVAFNQMMKKAIEVDHLFPAKRVYFCDLYTPCYRYDANGNLIDHMFQSATDLHPDWFGEYKMADAYLATIQAAIADQDASWQLDARETYPATTGCENNVPAEYLAGYTRARVFNVVANRLTALAKGAVVPYDDFSTSTAATTDLRRVGYYVELKRKDDSQTTFNGLTRWLWVSLDAFNDRTIDTVGVPLAVRAVTQAKGTNLRIKTNMPGIADTAPDAEGVDGWIEFWPNNYTDAGGGGNASPVNVWAYDWNDTYGTDSYGSMQIHRLTPGVRHPAQVLFAFNRWSGQTNYEIGLGNFANQVLGSIDWTFAGDPGKNMNETMGAAAYEVAKIEIWTMPFPPEPVAEIASIEQDGNVTQINLDVDSLGQNATSATVTLEWSTDSNFATVAGSRDLGSLDAPGTLSASVENLGGNAPWYFRVTAVNDNNDTGTATSDAYEPAANVWRPATTGDTWSSAAWKKNGAGTAALFNPLWSTLFDGAESAKPATVVVDAPFATERVTFNSAADYAVTGNGMITAKTLVKEGTGTLTLDSAAFANTDDIEVRAGKFKIGNNATMGVLGKNSGTLTVKNGAQVELNFASTTSGMNQPRAALTNHKKFVIEGAGPDGKGALVNNTGLNTWSNPINEIELSGDATIGGTDRIDLRMDAGSSSKARIHGGDEMTLTYAGSSYLNISTGSHLDVGKVAVTPGANLLFDATGSVNAPHGIDLRGVMSFYGASGTFSLGEAGTVVTGSEARLEPLNGTSNYGAPLTVEAGATVALKGSATVNYRGAVHNKGTMVQSSGTHQFMGTLTNEGTINVTGGTFRPEYGSELVNIGNPLIQQSVDTRMYATKVTGDMRWTATGGYLWMTGNESWGDSMMTLTLSGAGTIVLGENGNYGLPDFAPGKLVINAASGHTGTVFYHNGWGDSINGPYCTGKVDKFYAQGHTSPAIPHESTASNLVVTARDFAVGTGNGYSDWTFEGPETKITADTLSIDTVESKTYAGAMIFREGELTLNAGGITTSWRMPHRPQFTIVDGTLKAGANFAVGQPGMSANFGTPVHEGHVVVDLNGHTINWQTGLTGASDVTIRGAGAFTGGRPGIQGIPTGKWTVESTGDVSLRNAAGFAGGLELKEGANVTLDIAGESMVEFLVWSWHDNAWDRMRPLMTADAISFNAPHVSTSLAYFNRPKTAIVDTKKNKTNGTGFNALGEFYVSAEEAGTWTFYNKSSTHNGLIVDKTELSNPGPGGEKTSTIELTEGWHKFMVSFYTGSNNEVVGPVSGDMSFKYKNPVYTEYRKFDTTMLPMRMRSEPQARTTARIRKIKTYGDSTARFLGIQSHEWTTDISVWTLVEQLHTKYSNGEDAPMGGCSALIDGYFYVSREKSGTWNFQGKYDDCIALDVDGRRVFSVTGCAQSGGDAVLKAGWHKFEIRLADNTEKGTKNTGTGGLLTDSHGNVTALEFAINGVTSYESFDERYVPIAYQSGDAQKIEKPGLSAETTVAKDATLTNDTDAGGYCPINGTLAGEGTLAGPFRFAGDKNCWKVEGIYNRKALKKIAFENADDKTLAGLKRVEAVFDREPALYRYPLAPALGADVSAIELVCFDADGNDWTDKMSLVVDAGQLYLRNARPAGLTLIFR